MLKTELRQQIRQTKRQFSPQQLKELSLPIIARLRPRLAQAATVYAYYSLPDEVCTHTLVDDLAAEGKTVLLPKVTGPHTMEWHRYTSRANLVAGAYGIAEPDSSLADRIQVSSNCQLSILNSQFKAPIILVPGIAFDPQGHRLGRGKGYYDRFLAAHPDIYKIGVCFDFQKVPEVPVDEFDIPVDEVV
jgi:5-formyltetrahydrofolate cyclo-ligase